MRMIRAGLVLVLGGIATAGQKPTPTERPPGVVLRYNKDASGSIQGVCRSAEKGTVECNFTEVIFFPPYTANTRSEEQKIIEDLRKDPDAMKDRMATMAKETRDMMEKARGVMMGPKGRQEIDDLIKAA